MGIEGVGPTPCEWMLVGDGPNEEEARRNTPFCGKKIRRELDRFFDGARLPSRDDLFLTYLHRNYKGRDYIYTESDTRADEPQLENELRDVKPSLIVTLGREASRWFLGDVDMDAVHAIAWGCTRESHSHLTIFPVFHPNAGFYSPEVSSYVTYGFNQLAAYIDGAFDERKLFDDTHKNPTYIEVTSVAFLESLLKGIDSSTEMGIDTEGYVYAPWSIQFSITPGIGYTLRKREIIEAFWLLVRSQRPRLIYHSGLHELSMTRAMGLVADDLPFDDTMVMAYLLQVEPKGLKPLCVRHCGMQMQSYDDVMGDAGNKLAMDYLWSQFDIEQLDYETKQQEEFERLTTTPYTDAKGKVHPGRRITTLPKLPRTRLHKAVERCLQSKEPRRLWWDQQPDILNAGYEHLGSMPNATLNNVPLKTAITYAGRDPDGTLRVKRQLSGRIDALGLREVYNLELGTYPLLDRMMRAGIKPDMKHYDVLSMKLAHELEGIQARLDEETHMPGFNANSYLQVGKVLFDDNGLEPIKLTDGGDPSTNDKILEALEHANPHIPVIGTIREFREVHKLKSTFVDAIPSLVRRWPYDGRIHATFRTTSVVTGRLAASDPNILALPKHGKFAKEYRRGLVAELGHVLGEWDLSQIELRILAHLSQDPTMLAVFRLERRNPDGSPIDLHAALAERIFGIKPKDQDKSKHRLPAKAVNFGLPMGMQAQGLSLELRKNGLDISVDDAQRWIDETMALYKGVPVYQDRMKAEARRNGYIRCLSGRIRYIGGIHSRHAPTQSEAERFAFSTPIQEGAQWCMKQAEKRIWDDLLVPCWKQGDWIEPLMQVHDAIDLEIENEQLARDVNPLMCAIMTYPIDGFSVPIETSGDFGPNLADLKEF